MAGRAAQSQVLTEADDGLEEGAPQQVQNDNALGSAALEALTPQQQPTIHPARGDAPREEFDVLEVDDAGDPLDGGYQETVEEPLTEEAGGQRPIIESPEQIAERQQKPFRSRVEKRQAQKRARDRNLAELAASKNEIAALRDELGQLRGYVAQTVDPRLVELGNARLQGEVQSFDRAIQTEAQKLGDAQRRMGEAMTSQDGTAFGAALNEQNNALVAKARFEARREALVQAIQQQQNGGGQQNGNGSVSRETQRQPQTQPQTQPGVPGLGPRGQAYAQEFADAFPDFSVDGTDRESRIVRRLDQEVASEGYDPNSIDYWDELERRVQTNIPEWSSEAPRQQQPARRQPQATPRIQQQAVPQNTQRRGPAVAGAGDARPQNNGGRVQVQITPARKAAMISAGLLADDGTITNPAKFKATLAKYAEYDRANGAGR